MNATTKKILCYTLTPQIVPRVKSLFFSGFSFVAFFMGQIYRSTRLLPQGHPYLNPANMGKFGIRQVVAEAGNNLRFSRENIDQIVIFFLLLIGIGILFLQMAGLGLALFLPQAHALTLPSTFGVGQSFKEYFLVENATNDLAYVILDRVFGVQGSGAASIFTDRNGGTTCVVTGTDCFDLNQNSREYTPDGTYYTNYERTSTATITFPWPYHLALHKMLEYYSMGLLVIAAFIVIYFVAAVAAETASSGTAFGKRFNHVWAPLRIVAAVGALVPLNSGLNSVQYILLYAAKWGSGFATNGWIEFNEMATQTGDTLLGGTDTLVATPNTPPINTLLEFFTIVATCKVAYETMYYEKKEGDTRKQVKIDAYLINGKSTNMNPTRLEDSKFDDAGFEDALKYFNYGNFIIRFGSLRDGEFQTQEGRVAPLCGELMLQIPAVDRTTNPGSFRILRDYWSMIYTFWRAAVYYGMDPNTGGSNNNSSCESTKLCDYSAITTGNAYPLGCIGVNVSRRYLPICNNAGADLPGDNVLEALLDYYQIQIDNAITVGVTQQQNSPQWTKSLKALGWGGAAIWYNKVAELNGSLTGAAYSLPVVKKYPEIMEKIRKQRAMSDSDLTGASRHQPYRSSDRPMVFKDEEEAEIAKALYQAQNLWSDYYTKTTPSGNVLVSIIQSIFGTSGLYNMQENADKRIHPLAQLVAIGQAIMSSSIQNLGYAAAAGLGGGIVNTLGAQMVGKVGLIASSFLSQLALIGLSIGFVLYYILPMLPFLYFFFAVGGWVKGIFEAMVGVPLWALAHIRIDGEGLPGDAALGGYYLVLEVFLRPMCILFGFLASITIFAAQAQILHEIWPIIVSNIGGFDYDASTGLTEYETGDDHFLRGAIDQFFFTAIYAVIVYMLGMSCFKLIDLIPNYILRWMGASISTFVEQSGDPAENLMRNAYIGSQTVGGQLGGAMEGLKGAASSGGTAMRDLFRRSS